MCLSKPIRAPSASISRLHTKIMSQSSSFPDTLTSLIGGLASKDRADSVSSVAAAASLSNQEYNHMMEEMVSFGNQMLKIVSERTEKMGSEEVYHRDVLDLYDTLEWGFNSPFLWRIAESNIHSLYSNNVGAKHAEIGVGTGLFLSKDALSTCKSVTLMDLNQNSLNVCEKRILSSYLTDNRAPNVNKLIADITTEVSLASHKQKYDSVAANFLFHCLHGSSLNDKQPEFKNCAALHSSNGAFFGSTILGKEMTDDAEAAGEISLNVLKNYNDWGIFGNMGDSFKDLESILNELFSDVEVKKVGFCGVWSARGPK